MKTSFVLIEMTPCACWYSSTNAFFPSTKPHMSLQNNADDTVVKKLLKHIKYDSITDETCDELGQMAFNYLKADMITFIQGFSAVIGRVINGLCLSDWKDSSLTENMTRYHRKLYNSWAPLTTRYTKVSLLSFPHCNIVHLRNLLFGKMQLDYVQIDKKLEELKALENEVFVAIKAKRGAGEIKSEICDCSLAARILMEKNGPVWAELTVLFKDALSKSDKDEFICEFVLKNILNK